MLHTVREVSRAHDSGRHYVSQSRQCPHWPAIRVPSLRGTALEEVVCVEHVLHDVQPTLYQLVSYVCCPWQQASCGLVCYGHSPMPVVFPTGGMMCCSVFAGTWREAWSEHTLSAALAVPCSSASLTPTPSPSLHTHHLSALWGQRSHACTRGGAWD